MNSKSKVALVGAGSMGGSLLRGWLGAGAIEPSKSAIFDPALADDVAKLAVLHGIPCNPAITPTYDFLVIAIKPQIAIPALSPFAPIAKTAVVLSVMAGTSLSKLASALESPSKIVRAMPNLPSAAGAGIAGLYAADAVTAGERKIIDILMSAVGETVWVDQETDIDIITAISGSGPAYFFLLAESLAEAGIDAGLSRNDAEKLASATLVGAGALLKSASQSARMLRASVTSPGGTTAAALEILDGKNTTMRMLVKKAVSAAQRRARELSV